MTVHLVVATLLALAAALSADRLSQRLAPAMAARLLTATAVTAAGLTAWVLFALSLGGLDRSPWLAERLGWCRSVAGLSHDVPGPVAAASALALAAMLLRAGSLVRRWRRIRRVSGEDGLTVVDDRAPFAYAVPGRPGHIVVSNGILGLLDDGERRAMLAHEQAHLDLRHHRHLRACELAACHPLLAPVARSVRFATERWADEEAARVVGDRGLVARALSRTALASATPMPAGAAGGLLGEGVTERVTGLLGDPPPRFDASQALVMAASSGAMATAGALTVRLHDVAAVLAHFCGAG